MYTYHMNTKDILCEKEVSDALLERFIRYAGIWTTSDRTRKETPSTEGQWDLARLLCDELRAMGLDDVQLTPHCYVVARVPASAGLEHKPSIALMAHLDTSSEVSGKNVKVLVARDWDGKPLAQLNNAFIDGSTDAELASYHGDTILYTDGSTLLGADDKAGIAEIMCTLSWLLAHPEWKHGPLELIFTPDEETGKGLPEFPLQDLRSRRCYTLDGSALGELESECFNAYKVDISFHGRVIHIGHARGKLANALSMAASFVSMLPRSESPEATDGYYGYYCPMEMKGDLEKAELEVFLRDFEDEGMQRRLKSLEHFARAVEAQFPGGRVEITAQSQYQNMKKDIDADGTVLNLLLQAAKLRGIPLLQKPIRGGTDGSRLTQLGVPTPNIFAGGHQFHSRQEWASLREMYEATALVLELVRLWGEQPNEQE